MCFTPHQQPRPIETFSRLATMIARIIVLTDSLLEIAGRTAIVSTRRPTLKNIYPKTQKALYSSSPNVTTNMTVFVHSRPPAVNRSLHISMSYQRACRSWRGGSGVNLAFPTTLPKGAVASRVVSLSQVVSQDCRKLSQSPSSGKRACWSTPLKPIAPYPP